MRITIRRDLLGKSIPELIELQRAARDELVRADAALAATPATSDIGELVAVYERFMLASRDLGNVSAVLGIMGMNKRKGRAHHGKA